jgi:hypothetical protein
MNTRILTSTDLGKISELIKSDKKLLAIKLYRDTTGQSLQDAHIFINKIESEIKSETPLVFRLPAVSEHQKSSELITNEQNLKCILGEISPEWKLISFESGMGWQSKITYGSRSFWLLNDRGHLQIQEIINENLIDAPWIDIPHGLNLSEKMTLIELTSRAISAKI